MITDVTSWQSLVRAFKSAIRFSSGEAIDIVIACAGVNGEPFIIPSEQTPPSLDHDPSPPSSVSRLIDINVKGVYYTAKLAQHYFGLSTGSAESDGSSEKFRKCLILISSLVAYIPYPQIVDYPTSKWAVRGFFRSIRPQMEDLGYRVNLIAPDIMDVGMSTGILSVYKENNIPIGNSADAVQAAIRCAACDSLSGMS